MKKPLSAAVLLLAVIMALSLCGCTPAQAAVPTPVPTAAPTPTPTPTPVPTPEPTPEPTPTPIPGMKDAFYNAFFDSTVFIGDSITQGLRNYVLHQRDTEPELLGTAIFVAAQSYGLHDACSKRTGTGALSYKGHSVTLPEAVIATESQRVFIMLGVNNFAGYQIETCIEQYRKTVANIREVAPDVEIYIQSCTPVAADGEKRKLNNDNLDQFNAALQLLCGELSVHYVDISTPLKGEDNCMKEEYSSDHYVHVSKEGAAAWVDALYQYAYDSYSRGEWEHPVHPRG